MRGKSLMSVVVLSAMESAVQRGAKLLAVAGFIVLVSSANASFALQGSGTESDPYLIADANDLMVMAADTGDYDKCFMMTADIDLSGNTYEHSLIGHDDAFTGSFDGNGHIIRNLTIEGGNYRHHGGCPQDRTHAGYYQRC